MLGVEDERDVDRVRLVLGRLLAAEHEEQIGRDPEFGHRRDRLPAAAQPLVPRDRGRNPRDQPGRLVQVGVVLVRVLVLVRISEHGDDGAQHLHRGDVDGRIHGLRGVVRQLAALGQLRVEGCERTRARELAVQEQPADLLVGRVLREVLDRIAPVHEDAFVRVDRGDRRLGDDDARELD